MRLHFGEIVVTTLLDTGAARSILDYQVFLDICCRTGRAPLLKPTPPLHGVTGHSLELLGEAEIWEERMGRLTFVVAKGFGHYCILGGDILIPARAKIDFTDRCLHFLDQQIYLEEMEEGEIAELDNSPVPQSP